MSLEDWQNRFGMLERGNLLQSYGYARAICPLNRQKARWGLIQIDGQNAGMVQILEAGILGNLFHAVILDRGPLWFEGFSSAVHIQTFFECFNKQFPKRWGRKRRIIPEVEDGPAAKALFKTLGFERQASPGYQTVWLDLRPDEDVLRAGLRPNWRNKVKKAENRGLEVEWDETGKFFSGLLRNYQSDRVKKGYDGPSASVLKALARTFGESEEILIGQALLEKEVVAAIFILCHGATATYQVGWNSETGREVAAHNFLLWQALGILKEKGIKNFDLGGTNDDSAQHVKRFKEGLGGKTVTLVGHYF